MWVRKLYVYPCTILVHFKRTLRVPQPVTITQNTETINQSNIIAHVQGFFFVILLCLWGHSVSVTSQIETIYHIWCIFWPISNKTLQ